MSRPRRSESKKTRELCRELKKLGALVMPIVANKFAPPGWPDRYVHAASWRGWLEFKDADGQPSPIQRARIDELNRVSPGSAFVVRFDDDDSMIVEDGDGSTLDTAFDAKDLLDLLRRLSKVPRKRKHN